LLRAKIAQPTGFGRSVQRVEWVKPISPRDAREAWRSDLPLSPDLPEHLVLDLREVDDVHPMFALRLRVFADWHMAQGRAVDFLPPRTAAAGALLDALQLRAPAQPTGFVDLPDQPAGDRAIVPITRLRDETAVEEVGRLVREIVEYRLTDVAALGAACHMAVSELCGNAVEHGANPQGAYVAVLRSVTPRRRVSIAVADLGIGIPEHLRRQYPELSDDDHAIALAMQPRTTGTGRSNRGNGFSETFEAALASSLHALRIEIHAANGFVRREVVHERDKTETFPAARYKRGTWIVYELLTALA
jgi:anti-sigma regulatory factor (Ser/Thr protein kinase)